MVTMKVSSHDNYHSMKLDVTAPNGDLLRVTVAKSVTVTGRSRVPSLALRLTVAAVSKYFDNRDLCLTYGERLQHLATVGTASTSFSGFLFSL